MGLSTYALLKNAETKTRVEIEGELLKQMQRILLEILKDFARVCDKYGFYYSLCGGSALGAVRHKGFIPWDDDIDVFMKRSDYMKFLEVFQKELGDKYHLHSPETTPELGMPITQLMKNGTVLKSYTNPDCTDSGIYIDIFILENAPNNKILRKLHGLGSLCFGFILSCARFSQNKERLLDIFQSAGDDVIDAINKKALIGKFFCFLPLKKWASINAGWNSMCKNENSKYVVCPTGIKHYFHEIFLREEYCIAEMLHFEDTELRVIKDYDKALTRLYGDYMKMPQVEKRETHFCLEIDLGNNT